MGVNKRLMKLWKTRRADVITAYEVMAELGVIKKEDALHLFEKLDCFVAADRKAEMSSM